MQLFVTILHIILCLSLILIILLQPGKEGAAAFGGGGGNQMYGPRGSGHFLGKATTMVATLFMFTSITLAFYSSERTQVDSDIEDGIDRLDDEEEGFAIPAPTRTAAPPQPEPQQEEPPGGLDDQGGIVPPGSAIDSLDVDQDAAPAEGSDADAPTP